MHVLAVTIYPFITQAGTLTRVTAAAAKALAVPDHLMNIGCDEQQQLYGHLTVIRHEEGQENGMATARNLVDRLPELLGDDLQGVLRHVRVLWIETHAGIGILGIAVRTYELSVTY